MLIAIISDIHDNLANLEKCLNWCRANAVSRLICCGDITNSETLEFLAREFPGQIYLVRGNLEIYEKEEVKRYKNINYQGKTGIINIGRKVIGICHEPFLVSEIRKLSDCNIIFYGHTHKPWIEEVETPRLKVGASLRLVNPGTLGGVFAKATFAVWDSETGEPELKILELL